MGPGYRAAINVSPGPKKCQIFLADNKVVGSLFAQLYKYTNLDRSHLFFWIIIIIQGKIKSLKDTSEAQWSN